MANKILLITKNFFLTYEKNLSVLYVVTSMKVKQLLKNVLCVKLLLLNSKKWKKQQKVACSLLTNTLSV